MRMKSTLRVAAAFLVFCTGAYAQDENEDAELSRGEEVYTYWCATCHAAGPGMPGTQALQAKYQGSVPAVLTERDDLTPEIISGFVRNGVSVMPFFRKTEVSDADLAALADYVINGSPTD